MFNESRLLERVAYGSEFGHRYKTDIKELRNSIERRNAEWERPLGRYSLLFQNLDYADHQIVVAAHHACMGALVGFRLKDPTDFVADNEVIGYGTGTSETYQLKKKYIFGAFSYQREIVKPVAGAVTIYVDGNPVAASIDDTTGQVQLSADNGAEITWSGEFDVPVRFEEDEIGFSFDNRSRGAPVLTGNVDLLEIRL
ncbi:DUF2460 domain-containing protein [Microbulbifer sp. OS29]|uniref:DUF2460 domain-containing protein n=1 Tax=Microbulbifer okhotskensis TaxID=2926617 RepID=A0A9X2J8I4_9GAMM|nr:DUF2460 domain-containing protein [Microbulbifer okhotskensis]MCO1336885.1 DUF2460 domain-containing protein [Microbulbifer okhotskensis]